jgi:hypothetical protein
MTTKIERKIIVKKILIVVLVFMAAFAFGNLAADVQAEPEPEPNGYDIMAKLEELDAKLNLLIQIADVDFLLLDEVVESELEYGDEHHFIVHIETFTMYFFYFDVDDDVLVTLTDANGNLINQVTASSRQYFNPLLDPGDYVLVIEPLYEAGEFDYTFSVSTEWQRGYRYVIPTTRLASE